MPIITHLLVFAVGLILLIKGSDYFVRAAASIAKKFGVSEFIIGLTLVAVGTSIPELASAIMAVVRESGGLIVGNVVGSNIANVGLVIGVAATLATIKTEATMLKRDGYIMLFVALLFFLFISDGQISYWEAGLFLLLYFAYVMFLFETRGVSEEKSHIKSFAHYFFRFGYIASLKKSMIGAYKAVRNRLRPAEESLEMPRVGILLDLFTVLLGCAGIILGARYLIDESLYFADLLHLPQSVIGLTIIAIGTSLPELMVTITAARKGFGSIAIGSIVGSNITNVLLILGVSGLLMPLPIIRPIIIFSVPAMVLMSIALLVFVRTDWKIGRSEGISLLLAYAAFMSVLLLYFSAA